MSDYMPSDVQEKINTQADAQNKSDAMQAAARHGAESTKTAPSAQTQNYMGEKSNRDLNSSNEKARETFEQKQQEKEAIKTNNIQGLLAKPAIAPTAPIVAAQNAPAQAPVQAQAQSASITPMGQNKSLNMNIIPNATSDLPMLPNKEKFEMSSSAPPTGIGKDITVPKIGSIGYGTKTQVDFAEIFKADPKIISTAWLSGAESNVKPKEQDYLNVMKALDAMGYQYNKDDGGIDAMNQWRSIRNAAAQTSLAAYKKSGGTEWGIPLTKLSDGSMGRKLYSVPSGMGASMGQQKSKEPTPKINETNKGEKIPLKEDSNKGLDLSFLKNIDLGNIGNLVGDAVGQGSRGKLAYAGDFNFRTPQELRQMQQNARESEILKNRGLLGNELEYRSELNAPGGPESQRLTNEQEIQLAKAQENALKQSRIATEPANSMARQAQNLALINAAHPYALYKAGEGIDANQKSRGIAPLIGKPENNLTQGSGSKADDLVSKWLGGAAPNTSGTRASIYDANAQDVSQDLINGRKP